LLIVRTDQERSDAHAAGLGVGLSVLNDGPGSGGKPVIACAVGAAETRPLGDEGRPRFGDIALDVPIFP